MMKTATVLILSIVAPVVHGSGASIRKGSTDVELKRSLKQLPETQGYLFTMSECPGKCITASEDDLIHLKECSHNRDKFWEVDYTCAGGPDESFFKIRRGDLCISDPEDCSVCDHHIELVPCTSERAAWFSYGHLHKSSPRAHYLYSARCWLKEGLISVLATPSLDAKTCPDNHAEGACERLEWNLDHFSKDVLFYEWAFNEVKEDCHNSIFLETSK